MYVQSNSVTASAKGLCIVMMAAFLVAYLKDHPKP